MFLFWLTLTVIIVNGLCDQTDGGKAPTLELNDGNKIPVLGLGTFLGFDKDGQLKPKENEVENSVNWALDAGYRLIDTASVYLDEEHVGRGIRQNSVPRENIFIVTKLPSHQQRDVITSLKKSLALLNMSYVDLYLIHNPVAFKSDHSSYDIVDYLDTWKSMEQAKTLGFAKSIGISNFNISQIERLLANCEIKPAVLQVEVNLNLAQHNLIDFCKKNGLVVMAYTPFGTMFKSDNNLPAPRVDDPVLGELATKYKKKPPQIVLRYLVQRGLVPIPKSLHEDRIKDNINIFDFKLTPIEMEQLDKFNKDHRTVSMSFWQDHPYFPFEKVDNPEPNPFG